MSSLSPKDRVSLCRFTFADGRCCRTPRSSSHPHFCFDHAQKEARALAAETLGKDLAFFFSGDYLSANDLSTALARLIPAVVQGHVKPRAASTVAYLLQTLVQAIRISQHEYISAFGPDGWRKAIRSSVKGNLDYRFPPDPEPAQPEPSQPQPVPVAHPFRGEPFRSTGAPSSVPPPTQSQQPASQPAETPVNCHSERSEESAFSESPSAHAPQTPSSRACHPERSEGSCLDPAAPTTDETHLVPATQTAHPVPSAAQPNNPPPPATQSTPQSQPNTPNRDPYAVHFDHNYRLRESPTPF